METLKFIFYLGIAFTIFQMLWWLVNGVINYFRGTGEKTMAQAYILKAIHYILLMPVLVSFVALKANEGKITASTQWYYFSIVIGVTIVYLFGKIQRRQKVNKLRTSLNMMFKNSIAPFNFKWELIISIGAILFLVANLLFPVLYENNFISWISQTVDGIYDLFFIGLIFRLIGVIFVISLFWKLISGIRSLFGYNPEENSQFNVHVNQPHDQFNDSQQLDSDNDDEYTDYEEVE